jgi:hypothetical protein
LSAGEPSTSERKNSMDNSTSDGRSGRSVSPNPIKEALPEPATKKVTKGMATKMIDSMTTEWFSIFDMNEMEISVKELGSSEFHGDLIIRLINGALEKKSEEVKKTADLFVTLVNKKLLSQEDLKKRYL